MADIKTLISTAVTKAIEAAKSARALTLALLAKPSGADEIAATVRRAMRGMSKDRLQMAMLAATVWVAVFATSGIPVIGVSVHPLAWLTNTVAVATCWLGLHTMHCCKFRFSDFLTSPKSARTAIKRFRHLLPTVAKLLAVAVISWGVSLVLIAQAGGIWLLAETVLFMAASIAATWIAAYETAKSALKTRSAARTESLFPSPQESSKAA